MTEQTVTPIIIHNTANDLARVDLGALSPYLRVQLAALVSISEILSNGFKINQFHSTLFFAARLFLKCKEWE